MICDIIFFKHGRELGRMHWDHSLEAAKQQAISHAKIQDADRVEIRDEAGGLLFQHPRTVRKG